MSDDRQGGTGRLRPGLSVVAVIGVTSARKYASSVFCSSLLLAQVVQFEDRKKMRNNAIPRTTIETIQPRSLLRSVLSISMSPISLSVTFEHRYVALAHGKVGSNFQTEETAARSLLGDIHLAHDRLF